MKLLLLVLALDCSIACAEIPASKVLPNSSSAVIQLDLAAPNPPSSPVIVAPVVQREIDARIITQLPAWAWVQPTWTPLNQWTAYNPKWSVVSEIKTASKRFDQK